MIGKFFSNRVIDAWNELPQYVVDAETVNSFKARLGVYNLRTANREPANY